ncbi:MAG: hypothetical protein KJ737_04020 [Proteobacteria bacterium]|nr:hypothetical protein [Pseudomonadota bacterium]
MKPKDETGERRMNMDRRQFHYSFHLPERRKNGDRRRDQQEPVIQSCQNKKVSVHAVESYMMI